MSNQNMKLSAPWINFYHEIEAMFRTDPGITIRYDDEQKRITLFVESAVKAEALTALLPAERTFGSVTIYVDVVPANDGTPSKKDLFEAAFYGNPVFRFAENGPDFFTNPISYIVFKNKVVQYYNDDLSDLNGLHSTLYETIAEDIFEDHNGIYFCTDPGEARF